MGCTVNRVTFFFLTLSFLALLHGLGELAPVWARMRGTFAKEREADRLRQGVLCLRGLQDRLESGLIPEPEDWRRVLSITAPWGTVFYETLREARDQGAPVLPSLERMQRLLEEQARWFADATTKLAPAAGQALLALILVPLFAGALWFLLPGLSDHGLEFGLAASLSMLLGLAAFYWMSEMGERARFGQLPVSRRSWIASAVISLERLNGLVMTGQPPDLAWAQVLRELEARDPELAQRWGAMLWGEAAAPTRPLEPPTETLLIRLGHEVRRMIQTSLIEGQAALERIEAVQRSFMTDLRGRIEQDLARLGNQSLKPLFLLVMPAIALLMASALTLTLQSVLS